MYTFFFNCRKEFLFCFFLYSLLFSCFISFFFLCKNRDHASIQNYLTLILPLKLHPLTSQRRSNMVTYEAVVWWELLPLVLHLSSGKDFVTCPSCPFLSCPEPSPSFLSPLRVAPLALPLLRLLLPPALQSPTKKTPGLISKQK